MTLLKTGRTWDLILFALMFVALLYYYDRVKKGKSLPKIRKIAALDAIEEGVGRCIERGVPAHFSFGATGADLSKEFAGDTLAGLGILAYTARLCAKKGARLIFHLPEQAESSPILESTLIEAYMAEGKREDFDETRDMRFYGKGTRVVMSGMIDSILSEGCGLMIIVGRQSTTIYPVLENAQIQGGIVIGGNSRWTSMYIFAFTCDYMFIGEEVFAAGALSTGDPYMIGSVATEEIGKYFALVMIAIGLITSLIRVNFLGLMSI